ncbi:MAG: hypothetical protein LBV12_03390 [Puniceicoccales bacterium]|jgi:hypothetical protein|nr:hypothetical protein [Puniceicoccales bacterium]
MGTKLFNFLSSAMLCAAVFCLTGCPGESTKKAVSTVTGKTVENVKGTFAGISEGIDEGRKQVIGPDGAIVLTSLVGMDGKLSAEILKVEQGSPSYIFVTVGFANETEQDYRLTKIFDTAMLLDKEGYVTRLSGDIDDVTVPAKAKDKTTLKFEGTLGNFAKIRISGKDYPLPSTDAEKPATPIKLSTEANSEN